MKIESIFDPIFKSYGRIISGYDNAAIAAALDACSPLPEEGTQYVQDQPELAPFRAELSSNEYGGMPVQLGWCNGHNTKLNCLEYHRDSEVNLGTQDFILLLAKLDDIEDGKLDTAKVRAFYVPALTMVEVYGSTLHFAPCSAKRGQGFKVLVVLPMGTNGPKPDITPKNDEDRLLWACNKWLLAHPESTQAAKGAAAVLTGINIDISDDI